MIMADGMTAEEVLNAILRRPEMFGLVSKKGYDRLKAERDAALAVIERIRRAVAGHPKCDRYEEDDAISCGWKSAYASVVWALDGAPEPVWEWAVSVPGDDEPFSDVYQTREHLAEQETGIAWGEEQLVRRRKAGPWLPVEGESKP